MLKKAGNQLRIAFMLLLLMTLLTGGVYPLIVTGFAQLFFPWKANGSLLEMNGQVIGSKLIGQFFEDPSYFWGRPSATLFYPYNAFASSGSNFGSSNLEFLTAVKNRASALHYADPGNTQLIPVDLVTASGSGLDPEISPLAASYQIARVAKARHISESEIQTLIDKYTTKCMFGFLGERRVNVLLLNLALDNLTINKRDQHASSQS